MVRRAGGPTVGTKRAAAWVPLDGAQVKSKGKATAPAAGASSREMWAKAPSSVREAPTPSEGEHTRRPTHVVESLTITFKCYIYPP